MILPKESATFSSCRFNFLGFLLSRTRVNSSVTEISSVTHKIESNYRKILGSCSLCQISRLRLQVLRNCKTAETATTAQLTSSHLGGRFQLNLRSAHEEYGEFHAYTPHGHRDSCYTSSSCRECRCAGATDTSAPFLTPSMRHSHSHIRLRRQALCHVRETG